MSKEVTFQGKKLEIEYEDFEDDTPEDHETKRVDWFYKNPVTGAGESTNASDWEFHDIFAIDEATEDVAMFDDDNNESSTVIPPEAATSSAESETKEKSISVIWRSICEKNMLPHLDERGFKIYKWPEPVPQCFADITEGHKVWKQGEDQKAAAAAAATSETSALPSAGDEWQLFLGNVALYDGGLLDLVNAVALTFVKRAKSAFREGSTWKAFEAKERSIDSTPGADKRGVDNLLRLTVLTAIKHRLQEQIWLEEADA